MLRVHHLNCGCMCPLGGRIWDGVSRGPTGLLVCHCVLVETDRGLVLVDAGYGMEDMERPYGRLSPLFIHVNRIQFDWRLMTRKRIDGGGTGMNSVVTHQQGSGRSNSRSPTRGRT